MLTLPGMAMRPAAFLQVDRAAVDRGGAAVIVADVSGDRDRAVLIGRRRQPLPITRPPGPVILPLRVKRAVVAAVADVAGGRQRDLPGKRVQPAAAVAVDRRLRHPVDRAADAV